MTALLGLLELLMRESRESRADDPDSDDSDLGFQEQMAADDEEEAEIEEE